jgi:hypothetical protein
MSGCLDARLLQYPRFLRGGLATLAKAATWTVVCDVMEVRAECENL